MKAYGVFQGGGAKGFAHVGALKAAENRKIEFDAVAGTSIGAAIAALVAAGYKADELFLVDGDERKGLLAIDPLTQLDAADWKQWVQFRDRIGGFIWWNLFQAWLAKRRLNFASRIGPTNSLRLDMSIGGLLLFYLLSRPLALKIWRELGVTTTDKFRDWLDLALSAKITASDPDRRVRFRDIGVLKIVATDISSGSAQVFSKVTHPDMPVSDAVVASACFPIFFRPVVVDGIAYVDGGLMSNLPAWVFDEERSLGTDRLPTFGFRLLDLPVLKNQASGRFGEFVSNLAKSIFGGAAILETRRIDDCHVFDLVPEISTLAFDQVHKHAPRLVEAGRKGVERFFETRIGPQSPLRMSEALGVVSRLLKQEFEERGPAVGPLVTRILLPTDERLVRYAYSSDRCALDRQTTVPRAPSPSCCMELKEPVLLTTMGVFEFRGVHPLHLVEDALRPALTRSAYAVPIFANVGDWLNEQVDDRSMPIAALVVEAGVELKAHASERHMEDRLATAAQLVGDLLLRRRTVGDAEQTAGDVAMVEGAAEITTPRTLNPDDHSSWTKLAGSEAVWVSDRKTRAIFHDDFARRIIDRIEHRLKRMPE